jgi:hypothetical protein
MVYNPPNARYNERRLFAFALDADRLLFAFEMRNVLAATSADHAFHASGENRFNHSIIS